jgi:hypothetical protein
VALVVARWEGSVGGGSGHAVVGTLTQWELLFAGPILLLLPTYCPCPGARSAEFPHQLPGGSPGRCVYRVLLVCCMQSEPALAVLMQFSPLQ